jgi:hypothetical protein
LLTSLSLYFFDLIYPITLEIKDTAIQLGTDSEAG